MKLRFIDANVVIYSLSKGKNASPKTLENIDNSVKIIERLINDEETVYITTTQISETSNVVESSLGHEASIRVQKFLLDNPSIQVVEITHLDMLNAHQIVEKYKENKIGFNDAIAYISMIKTNCTEIYTFDKHFDIFPDIKRVEK